MIWFRNPSVETLWSYSHQKYLDNNLLLPPFTTFVIRICTYVAYIANNVDIRESRKLKGDVNNYDIYKSVFCVLSEGVQIW